MAMIEDAMADMMMMMMMMMECIEMDGCRCRYLKLYIDVNEVVGSTGLTG